MSKTALVLGAAGQDGSYLCEILLEKGYEVHGLVNYGTPLANIQHSLQRLVLHRGDLLDGSSLRRAVESIDPDEVYNAADIDNVGWSKDIPELSFQVTAASVGRLLEIAAEKNKWSANPVKVWQALSATMFGTTPGPHTEETPFAPDSPYAVAKVAAYYLCKYYREHRGLFVSTSILYNHTSPRQSEEYLLPKIARGAVQIKGQPFGERDCLPLGNLSQEVDVGYAKDYMLASWQMLQKDSSDDYVICTGQPCSIEEIATGALEAVNIPHNRHQTLITRDPKFYSPQVPPPRWGNPRKAYDRLGFTPSIHNAYEMVKFLVRSYQEKK